jgi:hypothetical protein
MRNPKRRFSFLKIESRIAGNVEIQLVKTQMIVVAILQRITLWWLFAIVVPAKIKCQLFIFISALPEHIKFTYADKK